MKHLPRVLKYLRPYRNLAVYSAFITALGSLVGLLGPWPLKILIDNVIQTAPGPALVVWLKAISGGSRLVLTVVIVLGGLLITLLSSLLNVLNNYVHTKLQEFMVLDLRSDLFRQAQRLSLAFHDRRRSGKLVYAINNQGDAAAGIVMMMPPLAESALTLIGMVTITFRMDHQLALLALTVAPFLFLSTRYYTRRVRGRLDEVREMESTSLSIIMEAISMLRVIVAFGREEHEYQRFRQQGEQAVNARIKLTVRQTLFATVVGLITGAGTALVLGVGVYHAAQGRLTVGQLLVVMTYIASIFKPIEAISLTIGGMQQKLVNLRAAFELLDTKLEIEDVPGAVTIERTAGHVVFENLGFTYTGRTDTLKDIDFEVKPGQVVAIVGPTGAGKTTLVNLLPRFHDPTSGRLLLDGHDTRKIALHSLRSQFSIVLQEALLFSGTIADNIRYGRLDATDEEIVAAAQAANAHEFIMRLPEKYQTVLSERGGAISGGERQRISVARAFLKNAPILILDEPTSSIDSKTEAVILEALDRLMVGRTTFLIAHRLATVRNADFIVVLNHGRIVEKGTQEQLLHAGGLYEQLYETQTARARRKPHGQLV